MLHSPPTPWPSLLAGSADRRLSAKCIQGSSKIGWRRPSSWCSRSQTSGGREQAQGESQRGSTPRPSEELLATVHSCRAAVDEPSNALICLSVFGRRKGNGRDA